MNTEENDTSKDPSIPHWKSNVHKQVRRVQTLLSKDIWESKYLGSKTAKARLYHLMRILVLTVQGLQRNNLQVQSAALTFYSLIGLGPLIALGIMVSGFMLDQSSESAAGSDANRAVEAITKVIAYAAPQLEVTTDGTVDGSSLAPEVIELVNNFIDAAQSGTVGIIGSLMLFAIGIQVLSSIERSFNSLWGVKKGRKLIERIIVYWTFISMGAVIGVAALTLITMPVLTQFMEQLPFGASMFAIILFISPILAFVMVILLLAAFFCFIPNTKVKWSAALTGATLVVALLHVYNMLSFLYVERVVDTRSLYGSVGIIVILMLGLYIFWSLILLGGQVTYAMQNADILTNENAWQKTSEQTQETISLGVLVIIAKRFQAGAAPVHLSELMQKLRVPGHVLGSSIQRLCTLGYLTTVVSDSLEGERDQAYQLSKPLDSISLGSFKCEFQAYGNNDGIELIAQSIPEVRTFIDEIISLKDCSAANITLGELIHS